LSLRRPRPGGTVAYMGKPIFRVLATGICLGTATWLTAQPINDNFADRIPLNGVRVSLTATNTGATREPGEPGLGNAQHGTLWRTVWWSWTAPADGVLAASVADSDFDAVLDFYTGETLQILESGTVSWCGISGSRCNKAHIEVVAGKTYQIVVGSESNSTGTFQLNLAFLPPPSNDSFANRIDLGWGNVTAVGTNTAATVEPGEPSPSFVGKTLWWSWTASSNGLVTIGVALGSPSADDELFTSLYEFNLGVSVFTGSSLETLVLVTNQNAYSRSQVWVDSQVTFETKAGTVYQIAVGGECGTFRPIELRIVQTAPPLVIVTAPANGFEFVHGDIVRAAAEAVDPDGRVRMMEFRVQGRYGGAEWINTVRGGSYVTEWADLRPGTYELDVRATDDLGAKSDAAPIGFEVRPWNDAFARRIAFTGSSTTVTGYLANATAEPGEPPGIGARSVWWSWTAPATDMFTITAVSASGYFPTLAVFTGDSISNLTLVGSSSFEGQDNTYSTRVVVSAEAGVAYALAIGTGGYGDWCGVRVARSVAPTVTLVSPTNNSSFVAGEKVTFTVDAQDPDGRVQSVSYILNDSQLLGIATNSPFALSVTFPNGGSLDRVRAWATDDAGLASSSDLVWFEVRNPGPPNDDFADRIPFTGSSVTVTSWTSNATLEPGEPYYVPSGSAWWEWTAPESGDFTLTGGLVAGYWPSLAVFSGSTLDTLNLITNDSFHGDNPAYSVRVVLHAVSGSVYPIAVGGGGGISLTVTKGLPPSVEMTAPTSGASLLMNQTFDLVAEAADPDGVISRVEFCHSNGSGSLGVVTNGPFVLHLNSSNLFVGYNWVIAEATDSQGLTSISTPVEVLVWPPGPPNDDFADRIPFTGSFVTVSGSTLNATFEPGEPYIPSGSAWWEWTAPESGDFTLTAESVIGRWPSLAVYSGSTLDTLNLITNDSFHGGNPTYSVGVVLHAVSGAVYPIAVGSGGDISLTVTKALPPSVEITAPTNGASVLLNEVFELVAEAADPDGVISRVEFYHSNGSRSLGVVTNGPFVLHLNSSNLFMGNNGVIAMATDNYGLRSASAAVELEVVYPPPPNDNFADRIGLSGTFLTTQVDLLNASLEQGETTSQPSFGIGSVWWSWVAPASGRVTLGCGVGFGLLGVYTGLNVSNLFVVATNQPMSSGTSLSFDAVAEKEYEICLVGYSGNPAPAQLTLCQDVRHMTVPKLSSNGQLSFQLFSTPGRSWIIEAGTDLRQWSAVSTGYCANGVLDFVETNAGRYPTRFYRAVNAP
jgi:hypothetical protein